MSKRKWVIVFSWALLLAVTIALLTNPSEQRHLDKFVLTAQGHQAQHVESCSQCTEPSGKDDLLRLLTSGPNTTGHPFGAGFRRRNYGVFSVLSPGGLRSARTLGLFGVVFGPNFAFPYECPAMLALQLPKPSEVDIGSEILEFSLETNGTITHLGAAISQSRLNELLRNVDNKTETAIVIKMPGNTAFKDARQWMRRFAAFEFKAVSVAIAEDNSGTIK